VSRTVTLYSRTDCALCDEAEALLRTFAARMGFAIERVDIAADPKLEHEYRWAIPVVAVAGREVARAPIRAAKLEDALAEAFAVD
jgi:glutaredoxin